MLVLDLVFLKPLNVILDSACFLNRMPRTSFIGVKEWSQYRLGPVVSENFQMASLEGDSFPIRYKRELGEGS